MPAPHHSVFLQAGCPSCRLTNSVKALKACTEALEGLVKVKSLKTLPVGEENISLFKCRAIASRY